ncbi:MAG: ABC transporter permease [Candidatus Thorarchaeota archaeon]|nr:ABC transporter permease [Candidatus Thorarchaeota archaeon]
MTVESDLLQITLQSLFISGSAALFASVIGLPVGLVLGLKRFRGRHAIIGVFNSLLGIPTVALGLLLYLVFSNAGPLGFLHMLYTPIGIIVGQTILVLPIMISVTTETLLGVDESIRNLALTMGADEQAAAFSVVRESVGGLLLAISASFSRAIAELGVALMIGGNIRGITRVLTTSIALETTRGEIALGLGLTVILIVLILIVNAGLNILKRRVQWWLWE